MKRAAVFVVGILLGTILVPLVSLAGGSFYVDATTGFVGVGNTTPASPLDVLGALYSRLVTASSTTIDWNAGNVQTITLSSSPTLTFDNGQAGGEYKLILKQDGTGGRAVTWPTSVKWANGTAPTLTTNANATDLASFVYDGSNYLGSYALDFRTPSTLVNNLVAYWKMDGSSADATGNGHDGTDTSITYNSGNGIINDGAGFTASGSSHIALADSSAFHNSAFTVNFWLKTTDTTNNAALFQVQQDASSHFYGFESFISDSGGNGYIQFGVGKGTGQTLHTDYDEITGTTNVADGSWHMVTVSYDGSTIKIYVDGALDNSNSWSGGVAYNSTNYARIGEFNQTGSGSNYGNTAMDEVGLWSRALTTTEISELYNSGSGSQYPF